MEMKHTIRERVMDDNGNIVSIASIPKVDARDEELAKAKATIEVMESQLVTMRQSLMELRKNNAELLADMKKYKGAFDLSQSKKDKK